MSMEEITLNEINTGAGDGLLEVERSGPGEVFCPACRRSSQTENTGGAGIGAEWENELRGVRCPVCGRPALPSSEYEARITAASAMLARIHGFGTVNIDGLDKIAGRPDGYFRKLMTSSPSSIPETDSPSGSDMFLLECACYTPALVKAAELRPPSGRAGLMRDMLRTAGGVTSGMNLGEAVMLIKLNDRLARTLSSVSNVIRSDVENTVRKEAVRRFPENIPECNGCFITDDQITLYYDERKPLAHIPMHDIGRTPVVCSHRSADVTPEDRSDMPWFSGSAWWVPESSYAERLKKSYSERAYGSGTTTSAASYYGGNTWRTLDERITAVTSMIDPAVPRGAADNNIRQHTDDETEAAPF